MSDMEARILSVQSHVVSGYVGNKSATFPLQLLGFEVDAINSVQFSNHTGYDHVRGQKLDSEQLWDLVEGLQKNNLHFYTHLINGYIGSKSFLECFGKVIGVLKEANPELLYVCDPVMGDSGPGMYVPAELLPIYRSTILPLADICLPNQFEAELLTERKITCEADAIEAMNILHDKGVGTVVLSSTELATGDVPELVSLASQKRSDGSRKVVRIHMPKLPREFTGTGDLFTALFTAWLYQTKGDIKVSLERTVATMQAVLKRTLDKVYSSLPEDKHADPPKQALELKLIQSKHDIENPEVKIQAEEVSL